MGSKTEKLDKILFGIHAILATSTAFFLEWGLFHAPAFEIDCAFRLTFLTQGAVLFYYLWTLKQDYSNLVSPPITKRPRYRDGTYSLLQILFPLSILVTVAYWAVRLQDADLIDPDHHGDPLILPLYNHGINATFLFLEIVFFEQIIIKGVVWKAIVTLGGTAVYISIQYTFKFFTGRHVYPFLKEFSAAGIIGFYGFLSVLIVTVERFSSFVISVVHAKANAKPIEVEMSAKERVKKD